MRVLYEKKGHVAYVTLNNPEKANILDRPTADELSEVWKETWEDMDVRVAILTAVGQRHFCAGHNLAVRPDITVEERERARTESIWKPVIGAINGWAAGAGFYLMLTSTDIRIACEEHARFKYALLSQGWVGNGPGATYLPRQVSYVDAMRILLTDEPFDAKEALRINLINEVTPHDSLMTRAEEIADSIARMPPLAVRMMKEFVIRFSDIPVTEAWRVQTLMNTLVTQMSTDGDEGRKAFFEKRPPEFKGELRRPGEPYPELGPEDRERREEVRRELFS